MWVDVQEHDNSIGGQYVPVEVTGRNDVQTGGIYMIRPGYSHRLQIDLEHEAGAKLGIYTVTEVRFGLFHSHCNNL